MRAPVTKVLVVGAGAIGSLLGARFAAAGDRVTLVGRPDHVRAIREHGLRIDGIAPGSFSVIATTDLAEAEAPDAVALAVKTYDLAAVSASLGRGLTRAAPLLLPQNGLHVDGPVAAALSLGGWGDPESWIVRAVNTIPATLVAPGVVRQPGVGEITLPDPASRGSASAATSAWRAHLHRAGIEVRTVLDFERELWRKALVNAAINPVTALHRVPNGRLLDPPYRSEALGLLREAQRAAAAAGFVFTDREADADLERVVRATARNRSSMLQDVERGRPTEIDAISGEIVMTAGARGIDLPRTREVIDRLHRARPSSPEPAQPS